MFGNVITSVVITRTLEGEFAMFFQCCSLRLSEVFDLE